MMSLDEDGVSYLITDFYDIAQEINSFFTGIGKTLVQKLRATANDKFLS